MPRAPDSSAKRLGVSRGLTPRFLYMAITCARGSDTERTLRQAFLTKRSFAMTLGSLVVAKGYKEQENSSLFFLGLFHRLAAWPSFFRFFLLWVSHLFWGHGPKARSS